MVTLSNELSLDVFIWNVSMYVRDPMYLVLLKKELYSSRYGQNIEHKSHKKFNTYWPSSSLVFDFEYEHIRLWTEHESCRKLNYISKDALTRLIRLI